MGWLHWVSHNWHSIVSDVGIIGALLFAALEMREETKARRTSNILAVTTNHREIWKTMLENPDLERVLRSDVDLDKRPVTSREKVFVTSIILHLASVYLAQKVDLVLIEKGLREDVGIFFSHPIPAKVWATARRFHNPDFVQFVESHVGAAHVDIS